MYLGRGVVDWEATRVESCLGTWAVSLDDRGPRRAVGKDRDWEKFKQGSQKRSLCQVQSRLLLLIRECHPLFRS